MIFRFNFALFAGVILAACTGDSQQVATAMSRDSAGIEIVENGGADHRLSPIVDTIWTLGGAQDERLLASRLSQRNVATDTRGRVYVLDPIQKTVLVLDTTGSVQRRLGQPGPGPGEFVRPSAIAVGPGDTIWISDPGKHAFLRWTADGQVQPEVVYDKTFWGDLEATALGVFYDSREPSTEDMERQRIRLLDQDSSQVALTYSAPTATQGDYPSCPRYGVSAPALFAHQPVWNAAANGTLFIAPDPAYRIDVRRAGALTRSIRRDVDPLPLDATSAARKWGDTLSISVLGCDIPPDELVAARGYAPSLPAVGDLTLSPDGRLYVEHLRIAPGDDVTDVFDAAGKYIGTFAPNVPFPLAIGPQRRFFVGVGVDQMGVPVVFAYRLLEDFSDEQFTR